MRLIKFRNGYSDTGRLGANYLQSSDVPYVMKVTPDSLVRRNGDYTNVFKTGSTPAAIYTVGRNAAGVYQVRGSTAARGTFSYVGAPQDGISITPNFNAYGLRTGVSVRLYAATPGTVTDFTGQNWVQYTFEVDKTRNGLSPVGYYSVPTVYPNFAGVTGTQFQFAVHGVYNVAGKPTFYTGACATQMGAGGQAGCLFVCDNGTTTSFGATLGYANAIPWFGETSTLAPGVLLKVDRYLRSTSTSYTLADPFVFTYSRDAGQTWAVCPAAPLIAAELATLVALTRSVGDVATFQQAVSWFKFMTAPLSRAQSVVLVAMPYMTGGALKSRVKMGVIDTATLTMTGSVVLFDNAAPQDAANFLKSVIGTKTGVLVSTRPFTPDANIWTRPMRVQVTTDGVGLVDVGTVPFTEANTGPNIRALSLHALVIPCYYAGQYLLYGSMDGGLTWAQRAILATDCQAPPGGQNITDFADLAFTRLGSASANAFPATPWLTDIRITP